MYDTDFYCDECDADEMEPCASWCREYLRSQADRNEGTY
jgi:hypothetical protein